MRAILWVWLVIAACSSAPEAGELAGETTLASVEVEASPDDCARVFSATDASVAPLVEAAALRWSLALGCSITVAEGGMPVVRVPELRTPSGELANGRARVFSVDGAFDHCEGLILSETSDDPARTVAHEMGHCLGAREHTATGGLLDERPLPGARIDSAALALVCAVLGCPEGATVAE